MPSECARPGSNCAIRLWACFRVAIRMRILSTISSQVARHSGRMESTPVGNWKDCDVIMQLANLGTDSRSTAENRRRVDCISCWLRSGRWPMPETPPRVPAGKGVPKRLYCSGRFTTFYNHLRWLDNLCRRAFIVLPVLRASEESGEAENV